MTKLFLSMSLLAMAGFSHVGASEDATARGRSETLLKELTRARRVLKGKGGDLHDYSMSYDMSYPSKNTAPKEALPKKKDHTDSKSKQGMAKLTKGSKAVKGAKEAGASKGIKGLAPKAPKDDGMFPDMSMSMSMETTTSAPTMSLGVPASTVGSASLPTAAVGDTDSMDSMAPVARRRH